MSRPKKTIPPGETIGAWTPKLGRGWASVSPWASRKLKRSPASLRKTSWPGV